VLSHTIPPEITHGTSSIFYKCPHRQPHKIFRSANEKSLAKLRIPAPILPSRMPYQSSRSPEVSYLSAVESQSSNGSPIPFPSRISPNPRAPSTPESVHNTQTHDNGRSPDAIPASGNRRTENIQSLSEPADISVPDNPTTSIEVNFISIII
jgi:hypothetical protein